MSRGTINIYKNYLIPLHSIETENAFEGSYIFYVKNLFTISSLIPRSKAFLVFSPNITPPPKGL